MLLEALSGAILGSTACYVWDRYTSKEVKLEKRLRRMFEATGFRVKYENGQIHYPKVKKVKEMDYGLVIDFKLPDGISYEIFKKLDDELNFILGGEVVFNLASNGFVQVKCFTNKLPEKVLFDESMLDECPDYEVPFLAGITREGLKYLELGSRSITIGGMPDMGKSTIINVGLPILKTLRPNTWIGFIDMKSGGVEASDYRDIFHIATSLEEALATSWLLRHEVERRGELFAKAGVKKLKQYNVKTGENLPYMILVCDEYSLL